MSDSTHRLAIRTSDAVLLNVPTLLGVGAIMVLSVRHGVVGALIGAIALFWGFVATRAGVWLFRRSDTRFTGLLLAAAAFVATVVLCLVSLFFYFRGLDL